MLGKLLKYEIKASSRLLLLLNAGVLVMAFLNMLVVGPLNAFGEPSKLLSIVTGLMMAFYVLLIIASAVVTLIVIIVRFYKNLMGDEGYLMFTLPVTATTHILSKLINAVIWSVVNCIVIVASILILLAHYNPLKEISEFYDAVSDSGIDVGSIIFMVTLLILVATIQGVLMLYGAMAWGPNLIRNRLGGSFVCYIILYIASQIIGTIVMFASPISKLLTNPYLDTSNVSSAAEAFDIGMAEIGWPIFWTSIIMAALLGAAYFFLAKTMLDKKLNLA
jgi:hypothetical protein